MPGRLAETPDACLLGGFLDAGNLMLLDRPIDLFVAYAAAAAAPPCPCPCSTSSGRSANVSVGMILLHHVDETVARHLFGHPPQDLPPLVLHARHDQVPEQQAPFGDPVGRETQITHLFKHCLQAFSGSGGVILRLE